ncbi:3'-5' exonuclease [Ketobacter sp.]
MSTSHLNRLWLRIQHRRWINRAQQPDLVNILRDPLSTSPFNHTRFLVVDLETTDLNPMTGEIASIAWVVIEQGAIQLPQSVHFHLRLKHEVGQSAVFHRLTDTDLQQGAPIQSAMQTLLKAARNSVLVFHNAQLDMGFINRFLVEEWGAPLLLPVLDTLQLERKKLTRRNKVIEAGDLRLHQCRQRYGLPTVLLHDALGDALATAELFLAMNA